MKVMTEVKLPEPQIRKNIRNDVRKDIEKYYLGKTDSHVGFSYGHLKNGVLNSRFTIRRTDIFILQYFAGRGGCNVFVTKKGNYQIDLFNETILSEADKRAIEKEVETLMQREAVYVEEQRKFIEHDQEISSAIHGKTPEEAVEILKSFEMKLYGRLLD